MKKSGMVVLLWLSVAAAGWAVTVKGASFPDRLSVGDEVLLLNGADVRQKTVFKINIYGLALYLTHPQSNAEAIINADEPMALRLTIETKLITAKEFVSATKEAYWESTSGNPTPIQSEIDQFISVFQHGIKKGEIYDLVYRPKTGLQVFKNEQKTPTVTIPGLAIKKATFGIWVGKRSDAQLMKIRQTLLGG